MDVGSAVARASRTYGEDINVVSVVLEEDSEDSLRLLPTFGLGGIPHIVDDRTVFERFGVTGHPAVVVQKPDGTFDRYAGFIGPQDLQDRIDEVLAAA